MCSRRPEDLIKIKLKYRDMDGILRSLGETTMNIRPSPIDDLSARLLSPRLSPFGFMRKGYPQIPLCFTLLRNQLNRPLNCC